jgi:hypothetical protein
MMVAANTTVIEGDRTTVDEQLRIFRTYMSSSEQSPEGVAKLKAIAERADRELRTQAGVLPGEPLPPGAYMRNYVVGYQVVKMSPDEVSVWVLARVTQKDGEYRSEKSTYTRTLGGAQWDGKDWKLTGAAIRRALQATQGKSRPEMVAPGDAGFNEAGWTAIRQAA